MNFIDYNHFETGVYKELSKEGSETAGLVKSFSHLRIENRLVNIKATYNFPILLTGSEVETEVKLDKNDLFVCTRLAMFIYERDNSTKNGGTQPLQTYPNASYFTAGTNFVVKDLETVYNGSLSFKKGTTVIGERFSTRPFRFVGDTQQSSATNKSNHYADSGMIPMTPVMKLPGREAFSIDAVFTPSSNINWQSDAANKDCMLVLMPFGFLVKGANI